jgi:hypothetical protein
MGFLGRHRAGRIRYLCWSLYWLWLTPDLFRLRRVTWKSTPSNQGCLLLVGPSFLGFPHFGDAPWARRHPPSMAGGGSRGIHAARPTPRRLRSACTQVAIGVVWDIAHLEARSRSTANTAVRPDAFPVGDAGGHDGTGRDSDEAVDQLQMSRLTYPHRPNAARAVAQLPQRSVCSWKSGYAT